MKDYASYSEKRLRKIADGETWSNHCEEEREAARRLLEHRTPQTKKNERPLGEIGDTDRDFRRRVQTRRLSQCPEA